MLFVLGGKLLKCTWKYVFLGYTPMHVAAIEGKSEAIRLLKKAGADINALVRKHCFVVTFNFLKLFL